MRRLPPALGVLAAIGLVIGVLWLRGDRGVGTTVRPPRPLRHVPEDASGPLQTIAIHYAPSFDAVALPVYRRLFAVLPGDIEVRVLVAAQKDFERFLAQLRAAGAPHLGRFIPVVVGTELTTWSRDRFAALVSDDGTTTILAPPRVAEVHTQRAGDGHAPAALAAALGVPAPVADFLFEGGDLVSTPATVFVDVNLVHRNLALGRATREELLRQLRRHVSQRIVWLGDEFGDVPQHHAMMYMAPLDDQRTVVVGDVHAGVTLLGSDASIPVATDEQVHARRFDRAAELLEEAGFRVVRIPAVVLEGGGSYVTYTNALFERRGGQKFIFLPTYALPALDQAATKIWADLGYTIVPVDVSSIYQLNGSLGCLVNIVRRAAG